MICNSLHNASYIVFTGILIFSKGRSTEEVSVAYIDIYNMT